MFWVRIFTIRRIIILVILLGSVFYFVPSWYVGNCISDITGSPVTANFSLSELLRGNIKFKKANDLFPR